MDKINSNIEIWKKKLLDTSKRNRSINFKPTKSSTLRIVYPNANDFFELLEEKGVEIANLFADENDDEFDVSEKTLLSENEKIEEDEYIIVHGIKLEKKDSYSKEELLPAIYSFNSNLKKINKTNYIFSDSSRKKQRNALSNILKKSRLFMEENAINIMHIAVGFLNWYESLDSKVVIKSPLFLLPAELQQEQFDSPFKLIFNDTEILLNTSLIKMMESEYKMDFNFYVDNEKDYLDNYISYKELLKSKFTDKRWFIEDDIHIGIFSFSKINMVKDIEENKSQLLDNKFIQLLTGEESDYEDDGRIYTEQELDQLIVPKDYFQALDADSSQELAIQAAVSGKSFVLQGPPGTGKSQTITNIISELISRGKRVLFVAEKKAALDVVYNNLKSEYSLPLHNSQIDKKVIIQELNKALIERQEVGEIPSDRLHKLDFKFTASRKKLSEYADSLLKKRPPLDKNIYEIYGLFFKYANAEDIKFNLKNLLEINFAKLNELETYVNEFEKVLKTLKYEVKSNTWYGLKNRNLGLNESENLELIIQKTNDESILLFNKVNEITNNLEFEDHYNFSRLNDLVEFIEHLQIMPLLDKNIINEVENNSYLLHIEKDIIKYQRYLNISDANLNLHDELKTLYDFDVYSTDANHIYRVFRSHTGFIKRLFSSQYKKAKRDLLLYQKTPRKKYKLLREDIEKIKTYIDNNELLEKLKQEITYKHFVTDDLCQLNSSINSLKWYGVFFGMLENKGFKFKENVVTNLEEIFNQNQFVKNDLDILKNMIERVGHLSKELQSYFAIDFRNFMNTSIKDLIDISKTMLHNFGSIQDYIALNNAYDRGHKEGVSEFYDNILSSLYKNGYWNIFLRRYYLSIIDNIQSQDEIINQFSRDIFDSVQKDFKSADKEMIRLAKFHVDTLIAKNTPSIDGLEGLNHGVLTLRREAQKSRKIMPIRKLFEEIPDLILTLKPCLMMSPLSVSSYLRSTEYKFDTVIFDEASQVRPESSLGAIYRSKQVIIVGDKEQLPPTNFFETVEDDNESELDASSFDSILDLASGILKPISLKWHYRSKFEDLIQTSNREIYKDLITFPSRSVASNREGIDFVKVDGVYVDRQNAAEAQKVAELVYEHFTRFKENRSLGIVTFGEAQQKAIENALYRVRKEHPELEPYFNHSKQEPFFVKNIETVQGDERDTIIISIGYGPEPISRNVSMNFGPLNRDGGYRRLNVAITRAKYNVILVTSISDSDIDLNRTQARGMRFLKKYLTFAEHGYDDKVDNLDYDANFDSPFEEDVFNEIEKMGYTVQKQLGSSGYKIDLVVRHPIINSSYILGIECDGAIYHSSKSARDRDRLRQEVLESRGWTIYRIWSTDWFKFKNREVERLKKAILNALNDFNKQKPKEEETLDVEIKKCKKAGKKVDFLVYPSYQKLQSQYASYDAAIILEKILLDIAPIHILEVQKLVPPFYDRQKYTSVVDSNFQNDFNYIISRKGTLKKIGDYIIAVNQPIKFRQTIESSSRRDFDNIHKEEIISGIVELLTIVEIVRLDDFVSQFIEYCGFKKSSEDIRNRLMTILKTLQKQNKIIIKKDIVEIIK